MVKINELTFEEAENILHSATPADIIERYNEKYDLNDDQLEFYEANGFIKLKNVLSGDALKFAKKVIEAAVLIRKGHDERELKDKSAYQQSFLQCGFLCWDFQPVKDLVLGKRFAGIAKELMKVDGINLWHDQALFKEPGGRSTDVHQDSSYWPVSDPKHTTTLWLSLNNAPVEKGCLYFYPSSHLLKREYVDIFKNPHSPEFLANIEPIATPLLEGDATFHSGLTYHGAFANTTDELREGMTIIYLSSDNRFDASDDRNATHLSCEGLMHGEIINSKYTPKII